MKITKFEHACFSVEQNNESIIVDPGTWTTNLEIPENVVGVVITHEHEDHLNIELLQNIIDTNPRAIVVAHEKIASKLQGFSTKPVAPNDVIGVSSFDLEFFGGDHAIIQKDMPSVANIGVLINGALYYPGDSFALPNKKIATLALPIAAPWLKISEVIDFLNSIRPETVFPTHDSILSSNGKHLLDTMLSLVASKNDIVYTRIDGQSIEV